MPKFIHNSGSYAHRGVWHVVESEKLETVPARDYEYKSDYFNATYKTHFPEHVVATCTVLCHSVTIRTGGLKYTSRGYNRKPYAEHQVIAVTNGVEPPQYWPEDVNMAPRPLCSRCAKKAGV